MQKSILLNKKKYLSLLFVLTLLLCAFLLWATNSQVADDYYFLYKRDTEMDLAVAFTVALRSNHSIAYELIDPNLTYRLNNWMELHEPPRCTQRSGDILGGGSGEGKISIYYSCYTKENRRYGLVIENIIVEDMIIKDWGEITEERN